MTSQHVGSEAAADRHDAAGRPGPVHLGLPTDALEAKLDPAGLSWPAAAEFAPKPMPLAAEKAAMAAINRASFENVTYGPTGFFLGYQAWHRNVSGVVKAPFPVFWGVQKG